ncbi:MAG TPA: Ig-like domain-containing protein [Gemmatimonadales bacterium]|nr:Ig-like domain-containing protein [Gemmatimonadales bacterium]
MRALLSRAAILLILAEIASGCGGQQTDPVGGALTTVVITPSTATLFTIAPGNTVMLSVVPKDQNGNTVTGAGAPTFSSENSAIATISNDGMVTAVAAGTAKITATLTAGGVTKEGIIGVTAQVVPMTGAVTAPHLAYSPTIIDVQAGGTVGWTNGIIAHTVTFTTAGAPESAAEFQDGSISRAFPTHGNFAYHCTIHPEMAGLVRVH